MKTIIKIYLSLALVFSQIFIINSANAQAVGGWTMSNPVAKGASTVYTGIKNVTINGADYIKKGTSVITPTAAGVSKVLARGVAGYALSIAVEQILGAVDWVLDPENSRIRYYEIDDPNQADYIWWIGDKSRWGTCYSESTCAAVYMSWMTGFENAINPKAECKKNGTSMDCTGTSDGGRRFDNTMSGTAQNPTAEKEEKYLPLEVVAQKVISNAEAGDTNAQVATTTAAADIVAEAETDETKARPITDQLNKSSSTKPADSDAAANAGTGTATATPQADPVTGEQAPPTDISLEFPVFCDWAPTICEAAQTVITFPTTLADWWISFRDWFKSDDDLPVDEKPQISEIPTPELKEDAIRWSAQCPADAQVPINMQGVSSTITFSWSPWCQLLDMIKPAIIASAYIGAAFIVLGLRT